MKTWVKFEDLEPDHCRYVRGERVRDYRFCGKTKLIGSSYCRDHAALCSSGKPDRSYWLHKAEEQKEAA